MKKLLTVLVMVLAFNLSNAQEDIFKVISSKKAATFAVLNEEAQHVIEVKGKTAIELYNATLIMIGDVWKNPDEVIAGKVEGEYIKVNGGTTPMIVTALVSTYLDSHATFTFRFKDGKMMYQISNLEVYYPASQYSTGGWSAWSIQRTRRNGTEASGARDNIDGFKSFVASIETSIINNLNTEAKSDW